jgi:hypothetical protein
MSLVEIDAVRRRLGATNNDIVLTVMSGAMHRWHTSRGAWNRLSRRCALPQDATEESASTV